MPGCLVPCASPHLRCRQFRRSGSSGWAPSWDGSGPESSVWGQNRQDPLPFTVELRFTNVLHVGGPKDQIVLSLEAGDKLCLLRAHLLAVRSWSHVALGFLPCTGHQSEDGSPLFLREEFTQLRDHLLRMQGYIKVPCSLSEA